MKEIFNVSLTREQLWQIRYTFRQDQQQIENSLQYAIMRNDSLLTEIFTGRLSQINDLLSALPEL